jgi:Flp pilus assembly protein TadD
VVVVLAAGPAALAQERRPADPALGRELTRTRDQLARAIAIAKQYKEERTLLQEQLRMAVQQTKELESRLASVEGRLAKGEEARAKLESEREGFGDRVHSVEAALAAAEERLEERDRELHAIRLRLAAGVIPPEQAKQVAEALAHAATLADQGDLKAAVRAYRDGLETWPEHIGLRIGLAGCHFQLGDMDRTREAADAVLDLAPEHPEALSLLGLAAWQDGDLREAARRLSQAVEGQPDLARYRVYHGIILFQRGRLAEARDELQTAVTLDPTSSEAAFNLAIAMAAGEKPDLPAARRQYQTALQIGASPDAALEKTLYPEQ